MTLAAYVNHITKFKWHITHLSPIKKIVANTWHEMPFDQASKTNKKNLGKSHVFVYAKSQIAKRLFYGPCVFFRLLFLKIRWAVSGRVTGSICRRLKIWRACLLACLLSPSPAATLPLECSLIYWDVDVAIITTKVLLSGRRSIFACWGDNCFGQGKVGFFRLRLEANLLDKKLIPSWENQTAALPTISTIFARNEQVNRDGNLVMKMEVKGFLVKRCSHSPSPWPKMEVKKFLRVSIDFQ